MAQDRVQQAFELIRDEAVSRLLPVSGYPGKLCEICIEIDKQYDKTENLYVYPDGHAAQHNKCANKYNIKKKEEAIGFRGNVRATS